MASVGDTENSPVASIDAADGSLRTSFVGLVRGVAPFSRVHA